MSTLLTWNLKGFGVPQPVVLVAALLMVVWHWPIFVVAFWLRMLDLAFRQSGKPRPPRPRRIELESDASTEYLL
jgi:hypothetical protein